MNLCVFADGVCVNCGTAKINERQACGGWRPGGVASEINSHKPRPGLGDMVAAGLSALGVTKERVSALVGGDCGCRERQEWLNRLGQKLGIGTPPPPESLHPPAQ